MEKKALQKSPLMSVIHGEWDCFEPRLWLNKMVNCSKWGRTKDRLSAGNFLFFVLTSDLHLILVKLQPHLNMMNNLTYWLHHLEFKLFCGVTESCVRAWLTYLAFQSPPAVLISFATCFLSFLPSSFSPSWKVNANSKEDVENDIL